MVLGQTAAVKRTRTFQGAVSILNSLQSNTSVVEQLHGRKKNLGLQLEAMQGFFHRTGFAVAELDKLNIIHVTGTKGKGSTCAFTERILRNYGFRTGFYSSPHLVHVRERIRINGWPISKELFTRYFWETYERLEDTKDISGGTMPFYFQFLTAGFPCFPAGKMIEVGIGGQYDCTNIIRKPWVCGVTSLGLDHCSLLGDTIDEIAWQKAGIFKPDVPAFTVRQPSSSMSVLQRRAQETGCPLKVCPELDHYEASVGPVSLGLAGKHQRLNASLALQLGLSWLQRYKAEEDGDVSSLSQTNCSVNSQVLPFKPSPAMLRGLHDTEWLGRNQTLTNGSVTYYLDGAHTTDSMQACISWFRQEMRDRELNEAAGLKILLFNMTGERDSAALLRLLVPCQFDYAFFCPNITDTPTAHHSISVCAQQMLARCRENQNIWKSLNTTEEMSQQQRHLVDSSGNHSQLFPCILSALQWINRRKQVLSAPDGSPTSSKVLAEASERLRQAEQVPVSVLVTGSLYLVGGVLKHLEPSLSS